MTLYQADILLNQFLSYEINIFFSVWVFFHEHLKFTGQQGKGKAVSLTSIYHFYLLHRHLKTLTGQLLERAHLYTQLAVRLELRTFGFHVQVADH